MNGHNENVSATVDMVTDRWLGSFLLSICKPGENSKTLEDARRLLRRHRDWAIESGIVHWRTPAHLRLYLMELVASAGHDAEPPKQLCPDCRDGKYKRCAHRHIHLCEAERDAITERDERECGLARALEELISADEKLSPTKAKEIAKLFQQSLPEYHGNLAPRRGRQQGKQDSTREIIERGAAEIAALLLRRCPLFFHRLEPLLGRYLADDWGKETHWMERAAEYAESLRTPTILDLSPCIDAFIDQLAKARLLPKVYKQAIATKKEALRLLEIHQDMCTGEEGVELSVLRRDIEYAAFMHDWYRGTDPARLLTLASEWNLQDLTGEEWSNPGLLQGRLATTVLKTMYGAENVLGTSRYKRITDMVDNCVVGDPHASALAKIFFLANAVCEWRPEDKMEEESWSGWRAALDKEQIEDAYELAIKEMDQAPWDLGYVKGDDQKPRISTGVATLPLPDDEEADGP
jgi:HD superfamily phosphohydrolase YqeK